MIVGKTKIVCTSRSVSSINRLLNSKPSRTKSALTSSIAVKLKLGNRVFRKLLKVVYLLFRSFVRKVVAIFSDLAYIVFVMLDIDKAFVLTFLWGEAKLESIPCPYNRLFKVFLTRCFIGMNKSESPNIPKYKGHP